MGCSTREVFALIKSSLVVVAKEDLMVLEREPTATEDAVEGLDVLTVVLGLDVGVVRALVVDVVALVVEAVVFNVVVVGRVVVLVIVVVGAVLVVVVEVVAVVVPRVTAETVLAMEAAVVLETGTSERINGLFFTITRSWNCRFTPSWS